MARFCVVMSDKDNAPGLRTTHPVKEAMAVKLKSYLDEDAVFFCNHFVNVVDDKSEKQIKKELCDELCEYKCIVELPKTAFQETKRTFTGKMGGLVDDMAVCL